MNQEEFIEEHPSLKGKISDFSKDQLLFSDRHGYTKYASLGQIHKTQLDKSVVNDTLEHWLKLDKGLLKKIKEELGL